VAGGRILLARARDGRPELPAGLRKARATVDDVAFYDTVGVTPSPEAVDRMLAGDMVVLTAPSAVGALGDLIGRERANAIRVVSIGPTTSIAARDAGLTVVAESKEQSVDGLVAAILRSRFPPPPDGEG
jgi:uroporphyrinogen-III synthase